MTINHNLWTYYGTFKECKMTVQDLADRAGISRGLLWGRQFLNPFAFDDLAPEYAELAKVAGDVRKHFQNNA